MAYLVDEIVSRWIGLPGPQQACDYLRAAFEVNGFSAKESFCTARNELHIGSLDTPGMRTANGYVEGTIESPDYNRLFPPAG